MAYRLFGAKPLSEPMLPYCQLDLKEYISENYCFEIQKFSLKKSLENVVCEMAVILSRPQYVKLHGLNYSSYSYPREFIAMHENVEYCMIRCEY